MENKKEEIRISLLELFKRPVPIVLSPAARCYEVDRPPKVATYICPVCSEKPFILLL